MSRIKDLQTIRDAMGPCRKNPEAYHAFARLERFVAVVSHEAAGIPEAGSIRQALRDWLACQPAEQP